MLTTDQKTTILRKAGIAVFQRTTSSACAPRKQAGALFVEYTAHRTDRSPRNAVKARAQGTLAHKSLRAAE